MRLEITHYRSSLNLGNETNDSSQTEIRGKDKEQIKVTESEPVDKEIESIFSETAIDGAVLAKRLKTSSRTGRLSRLAPTPNSRSATKNINKICYQYAAFHLLENFLTLYGYDSDILDTLDLDIIDVVYLLQKDKVVYLKILYDPDEDIIEDISTQIFKDLDTETHIMVPTKILEATDTIIKFYPFIHPCDNKKKQLSADFESQDVFGKMLKYGNALDYLNDIIQKLKDEDKIENNHEIKDVNIQNADISIGELWRLKSRQHENSYHVITVIFKDTYYEVGDDDERLPFDSKDVLDEIYEQKWIIVDKQEIYSTGG
tara:strand:- start:3237 stop:4184 length:948 start_codon:yes stop_codon:yes gene_type:complete